MKWNRRYTILAGILSLALIAAFGGSYLMPSADANSDKIEILVYKQPG